MTAPVTPILLTALQTALPITTNTAPIPGAINVYNASAGSLTVTLPAVSGLNVGAIAQVEKDPLDTSTNSITFNRNGGDTFTDGSTSYVLTTTGWYATLQVVTVIGQKYWKVIGQGGPTPVPAGVLMALASDYTLTDTATAQKAFNASTNGAVTLPANSSYLLEAEYSITNTGTTSHTWAILFAGTATLTALDFRVRGRSGVTSQLTLTADSSASQSNGAGSLPSTALVVTAASVSATENVLLSIAGILRINATGTFIPQVKMSAAAVGTEKMLRGSYIQLTPFGSNTATSLGAWS